VAVGSAPNFTRSPSPTPPAFASLLAWWGSRPLGIWVQRTLTVSTRFADAEVQHVKRVVHASGKTATFLVYVAVKPA
jgi:hypothetical protein